MRAFSQPLRDKVLGFSKFGEIINTIIDWNKNIDNDIKEKKMQYLLTLYFDKFDKYEHAISKLKYFIANPQGNAIYNKILRILDSTPPDKELILHLSSALKYMACGEFVKLFEEHKYALSEIEQMTPQALTILSDYQNWPNFRPGSFTSTGTLIESDWTAYFFGEYAQKKGIADDETARRLHHSIRQLSTQRLVEGRLTGGRAVCAPTEIGQLVIKYLTATDSG